MLMRKVRRGPSWWRTRAIAAAIASPRADSGRTSGGAASGGALRRAAAGSEALTKVPFPTAPSR